MQFWVNLASEVEERRGRVIFLYNCHRVNVAFVKIS